ncbi:MAG: hypothetical protein KGV57_01960 [Fusobacterium sp.]|nr:hypothetical protein [Fusobacterium sp.]
MLAFVIGIILGAIYLVANLVMCLFTRDEDMRKAGAVVITIVIAIIWYKFFL